MSKRMVGIAMAATLLVGGVGAAGLIWSGDGEPEPLRLAAGAGAATEAAADTSALRLPTEYRLADGFELPDLAGSAPAYRLDAADGEARAGRLAAALGLPSPGPLPAEEGGGWRAEADGTVLTVRAVAGLPWDLSMAVAEPDRVVASPPVESGGDASVSCDMPPCPEGQACIQMCPEPEPVVEEEVIEPEPPTNLPSPADAEARVRQLLADAGVDLAGAGVEAHGDEWGTWVEVRHAVDGAPVAGLVSSFSFGSEARIQWANGFLGGVVRLDDYPLAGTARGYERLQAFEHVHPGIGMGGVVTLEASTAVASPASTEEDAVTSESGTSEPSSGEPGATEPAGAAGCPPEADCVAPEPGVEPGIEPHPEPEPIEPVVVEVTGVELRLAALSSADGGTLVVPIYAFTVQGPDGDPWEELVLAVADQYVAEVVGFPPA